MISTPLTGGPEQPDQEAGLGHGPEPERVGQPADEPAVGRVRVRAEVHHAVLPGGQVRHEGLSGIEGTEVIK